MDLAASALPMAQPRDDAHLLGTGGLGGLRSCSSLCSGLGLGCSGGRVGDGVGRLWDVVWDLEGWVGKAAFGELAIATHVLSASGFEEA
jgi:hypothetical protein